MKWFKLLALCLIVLEIGALVYVADVQSKKIEYGFDKPVTTSLKTKFAAIEDFGYMIETDKELLEFDFPNKHIGHKLMIIIEVEHCILEGVYTMEYTGAGQWGVDNATGLEKHGIVNTLTFRPSSTDSLLVIAVTPMAWNGDLPIYSGSLSVYIELEIG